MKRKCYCDLNVIVVKLTRINLIVSLNYCIEQTHQAILYNLERATNGPQQGQPVGFRAFLPAALTSPSRPSIENRSDELNSSRVAHQVSSSQRIFEERMDYLSVDSDMETMSNASSTHQLHIEELSDATSKDEESLIDKTVLYDWQEDVNISNDESSRSAHTRVRPVRVKLSESPEHEKPPSRVRVKRSKNVDIERPLLRQPLVTNRYKNILND